MEIYDVYISIGPACRPAYQLSRNGLRQEAFPLDWQMEYSLNTVIHLFRTSFVDFFEFIEEDKKIESGDKRNKRVVDTKNKIISIHHFLKDKNLQDEQILFRKQMQNRFFRLNEKIKSADKILLLCNRDDSIEMLILFLKQFHDIYPELEIKMINIRNDNSLVSDEFYKEEFCVSNKLSFVEYIFNDSYDTESNKFDWKGNTKKWDMVLEEYSSPYIIKKMQKLKKRKENIVVYGGGKRSFDIIHILRKFDIGINGIVVTDRKQNLDYIDGIKVSSIENYEKDTLFIISVDDNSAQEQIKTCLFEKGYFNYILYDKGKWSN